MKNLKTAAVERFSLRILKTAAAAVECIFNENLETAVERFSMRIWKSTTAECLSLRILKFRDFQCKFGNGVPFTTENSRTAVE
ncbi:MAG: hypothetical protein KJ043_22410 [Anaerolineae bacterium]|nr:hypothetical protein [Anaerolineae bacterium]